MPAWIKVFSYISPFKYVFENFCMVEFTENEYPAAKQMLVFLDINRGYWEGIIILVALTVCI